MVSDCMAVSGRWHRQFVPGHWRLTGWKCSGTDAMVEEAKVLPSIWRSLICHFKRISRRERHFIYCNATWRNDCIPRRDHCSCDISRLTHQQFHIADHIGPSRSYTNRDSYCVTAAWAGARACAMINDWTERTEISIVPVPVCIMSAIDKFNVTPLRWRELFDW